MGQRMLAPRAARQWRPHDGCEIRDEQRCHCAQLRALAVGRAIFVTCVGGSLVYSSAETPLQVVAPP